MPFFRHRVTGPGSAGDIWTVTMHSSSATALATVHTAWTTLVNGFCSATMNALWPNEVSATETVTDELSPSTGKNVAQVRSAIAQVGTGAGGTLSPRTAVVIGLRTGLPTRSGRGRMYWPAPDATHLVGAGNLDGTTAAAIAAAFASRLTTFKATSIPQVYHRSSLTGTPVVSVTVGIVLGTQRRRTNKVANSYSQNTI